MLILFAALMLVIVPAAISDEARAENEAPVAEITSISPSPAVPEDNVHFVGSGTDTDGTIANYSWRSSMDGDLYNGSDADFYEGDLGSELSVGTHTIYLKVQDDNDTWSDEVETTLVIHEKPEAIIESVSPNPAYDINVIDFFGNGTDDGEIERYVWRSSIDGELYNGTSTRYSPGAGDLSTGTHIIFLKVMDDNGAWSDEVNTTLIVFEDTGADPNKAAAPIWNVGQTWTWKYKYEFLFTETKTDVTETVTYTNVEKTVGDTVYYCYEIDVVNVGDSAGHGTLWLSMDDFTLVDYEGLTTHISDALGKMDFPLEVGKTWIADYPMECVGTDTLKVDGIEYECFKIVETGIVEATYWYSPAHRNIVREKDSPTSVRLSGLEGGEDDGNEYDYPIIGPLLDILAGACFVGGCLFCLLVCFSPIILIVLIIVLLMRRKKKAASTSSYGGGYGGYGGAAAGAGGDKKTAKREAKERKKREKMEKKASKKGQPLPQQPGMVDPSSLQGMGSASSIGMQQGQVPQQGPQQPGAVQQQFPLPQQPVTPQVPGMRQGQVPQQGPQQPDAVQQQFPPSQQPMTPQVPGMQQGQVPQQGAQQPDAVQQQFPPPQQPVAPQVPGMQQGQVPQQGAQQPDAVQQQFPLPRQQPAPPATPQAPQQAQQWQCPKCGNMVDGKYKFCTQCGTMRQ